MSKNLTSQDTAYKLQEEIVDNKEDLSAYTKEELRSFHVTLKKQRDELFAEYNKFNHPADWYDYYVHPFDWAISKLDYAIEELETSEEHSEDW